MTKKLEHEQARAFRLSGLSIPSIAKKLHVSKGSVSNWVDDIRLTDEQIDNFRKNSLRNLDLARKSRETRKRENKIIRNSYRAEGKNFSKKKEPLHIQGCMLYWAEGGKGRRTVQLANSDPDLIELFILFLKTYFPEESQRLVLRVRFYVNNGLSCQEIEKFWRNKSGLDRVVLYEIVPSLQPSSKKEKSVSRLPHGVATVVLSSTKVIQHIYGALQGYIGKDREFERYI